MAIVYISPDKPSYKTNLHCHTTYSDGSYTPEQIKQAYLGQGYSIVCYTDHNVLWDHSYLNDDRFFAMLGIEIDVYAQDDPRSWTCNPAFHLNCYPRKTGQTAIPCYNPCHIRHGDLQEMTRKAQKFIGTPDYQRDYHNFQEVIDHYVDEGFLVQLNHPTWSVQTTTDYEAIKNCFAIELYNHSSFTHGWNELNTHVWDDLLRQGHRLYGVATDDNHNRRPNTRFWDAFGGFCFIQADALTQEAVTDALADGRFYASTGPRFRCLSLEGNTLHVECDPVDHIFVTATYRNAKIAYPDGKDTIDGADFDLSTFFPGYVRVTLVDRYGKQAWSQPIYDAPGNGQTL